MADNKTEIVTSGLDHAAEVIKKVGKVAPKPAMLPGTFSDPFEPAPGKDYAAEVKQNLPPSITPAKVIEKQTA